MNPQRILHLYEPRKKYSLCLFQHCIETLLISFQQFTIPCLAFYVFYHGNSHSDTLVGFHLSVAFVSFYSVFFYFQFL